MHGRRVKGNTSGQQGPAQILVRFGLEASHESVPDWTVENTPLLGIIPHTTRNYHLSLSSSLVKFIRNQIGILQFNTSHLMLLLSLKPHIVFSSSNFYIITDVSINSCRVPQTFRENNFIQYNYLNKFSGRALEKRHWTKLPNKLTLKS